MLTTDSRALSDPALSRITGDQPHHSRRRVSANSPAPPPTRQNPRGLSNRVNASSTSPRVPTLAIVVGDSTAPLETAAVLESFATYLHYGPAEGADSIAFASATDSPKEIPVLGPGHTRIPLCEVAGAQVVFLAPPYPSRSAFVHSTDRFMATEANDHLGEVLSRAITSGATVLAVGSSVFTLAQTGLLDGRVATTHGSLATRFQLHFPHVLLRPEALFVDDGSILTAAGGASTIDACLHLITRLGGRAHATRVEHDLQVSAPRTERHNQRLDWHRTTPDAQIAELLDWAADNLHLQLSIDVLASRSFMSRRSLARRFRAATGTTPYAWVIEQRIRLARELLADQRHASVEDIARRVGFQNSGALRQHFIRSVGLTPSQYREAIRS